MLIVTDLKGNTEPLVDIQGAEIKEEVNGDFSISFTSFLTENNKYSFPLLKEESKIELDGHEYRIKQIGENRGRTSVKALHTYFDLINTKKEDIFGGTRTPQAVFEWLLSGTGWTFEIDSSLASKSFLFPNFGKGNLVALVKQACEIIGAKRRIMQNKHIKIGYRVGSDKDEQFRYKHNIKTFKRNTDSTNLITAVKGYGADNLVVTYISPNANKYDQIHWADDVYDDQYTDAGSFTERLKQEINDVPDISIDIETAALGFDVDLDDGIWTIYEPLDIEYLSTVAAIKRYPFTNRSPVVTLSNKQVTLTDNLIQTIIEIDQNKKQVQSKFEQVNDRITMEVEEIEGSISRVELKADNVELSVNNRITNEMAAINIRADNISSSVSSMNSRLGNAESLISQTASEVSSKVSLTDFNGNTIASKINQDAYAVRIQAQRIALEGLVTTNDITVGNSIRLGNASWGTKSMIFNDSTYISGVDGRMEFTAPVGGLNFMSYTSFHSTLDARYASEVHGIPRSNQQATFSWTSEGGMTVNVGGRSFYYKPD